MGYVNPRADITAAQVASNSPTIAATAVKVKGLILANIARHNKTGNFSRSIRIVRRGGAAVKDTVIESTDPDATFIELGHMWVTPEGKRIKWIKGIYVFNNAFDQMKKGG